MFIELYKLLLLCKRLWPAFILLVCFAGIFGLSFNGLWQYVTFDWEYLWSLSTSQYIRSILSFSFLQACLSTLLSLLMGIMIALALNRRRFPGHRFLIAVLSVTFVLPPLVVVSGIIAVFGRNGWLSLVLQSLFDSSLNQILYGLPGVLLAHVFFNAAFCARVMLSQLNRVSVSQWRQAQSLDFTPLSTWRFIDWPHIRPCLTNLSILVFLLTFTSFSIVLVLGGGPKASTLEVAIFEALKFDFDIGKAVILSCLQLCISSLFILILSYKKIPWSFASIERDKQQGKSLRPDLRTFPTMLLDAFTFLLVFVIYVLPLSAFMSKGFIQLIQGKGLDKHSLYASLTSFLIAMFASFLCLLFALAIALTWRQAHTKMRDYQSNFARLIAEITDKASLVILIVPMFVLSTGLFISLRSNAGSLLTTLLLLIIINAFMALPFVVTQLSPALLNSAKKVDRLCFMLELSGFRRFMRIDLPLIRLALARASAYSMAMSLGDLGVMALFGSQDLRTLPFLLYQRMGSYQFGDATATALILFVLVLFIFLAAEALGYSRQDRSKHA